MAQGLECSALVQQALEATDEVCDDTDRNQACYGHIRLEAELQSSDLSLKFSEAGDKVDVAHLRTLRLSPLDVQNEEWGVALMKLQADIPASMPDDNVTLLVFGDVELHNAINETVFVDVSVAGGRNANVRRQPSNRAFVIGTVSPGEIVRARGRLENTSWIYVDLASGVSGWIRSGLVTSAQNIEQLRVLDPALVSYGPMQAFFLENGTNQTSCQEAPNDGILVQTPEGVAQVRLWINEVKIRLGSTAFIQSQPDQQKIVVNTLEGEAHVEALGVEQVAVAGTSVTVPLGENREPIAPPSAPQAYNLNGVQNLPVQSLERQITIAPPAEPTLGNTLIPSGTLPFTELPTLTEMTATLSTPESVTQLPTSQGGQGITNTPLGSSTPFSTPEGTSTNSGALPTQPMTPTAPPTQPMTPTDSVPTVLPTQPMTPTDSVPTVLPTQPMTPTQAT